MRVFIAVFLCIALAGCKKSYYSPQRYEVDGEENDCVKLKSMCAYTVLNKADNELFISVDQVVIHLKNPRKGGFWFVDSSDASADITIDGKPFSVGNTGTYAGNLIIVEYGKRVSGTFYFDVPGHTVRNGVFNDLRVE